MKITIKLISCILLGNLIILILYGTYSVKRELGYFERDMKKNARVLGLAMKGLVKDVWIHRGQTEALRMIEDANKEEHRVLIRWVWINASDKSEFTPAISIDKLKKLNEKKELYFFGKDSSGQEKLFLYIPVDVNSSKKGALELSEFEKKHKAYIRNTIIQISVLVIIMVLVCAFMAYILGYLMLGKPLQQITKMASLLGEGVLNAPIPIRGKLELSEFSHALESLRNKLLEVKYKSQKESENKLAIVEEMNHADRLRTVGTLASEMAHEMGTPLSIISGRASIIANGKISSIDVGKNAKIIKEQSYKITGIINQLLSFSKQDQKQITRINLLEITQKSLNMLALLGHKKKISLFYVGENHPVWIRANAAQIQQVLANLINNGIYAMPDGGVIEMGIDPKIFTNHRTPLNQEGKFVRLYVKDAGIGMTELDKKQIFEPFFTTKNSNEGTGLGLSIVFDIVTNFGGWIDVESEYGNGSCFSIFLPHWSE